MKFKIIKDPPKKIVGISTFEAEVYFIGDRNGEMVDSQSFKIPADCCQELTEQDAVLSKDAWILSEYS